MSLQDPADRPKFFQTQDFQVLNDEWKQKLKDSDFEDIERDEDNLREYASSDFKKRPEYDQSKAEYYRLAGHFLHDYQFRGPNREWLKQIWGYHADGKSIREIIKLVDPEGKEPFGRWYKKIQADLDKLSKRMVKRCQKQMNQQ